MVTVAATGHRPQRLVGIPERAVFDACRAFLATLEPEQAVSGMALGFDTIFARAALSLRIPLIAACPGEPGQQPSRWAAVDRAVYFDLLARAVEVAHITNAPTYGRCCTLRNEYMVDRADVMLALWNGEKRGTGHCAGYADRRGVPLVNLWGLVA